MKFVNRQAQLFVPDGTDERAALARTTVLCVAAHQDDVELMCYQGIADCFGRDDKWFGAVVMTDGAGSPRDGLYAKYTDEQMKAVRVTEQKKAAYVGEYGAQMLLGYSSAQVKDPACTAAVEELAAILRATRPQVLFTHNFADKHDTHVGVACKVLAAVRLLQANERPQKLYGCEVWRDLDWVPDERKTVFDVSAHPNLAASLVGVFDSQICGGKRYDLAAVGRRTANATYAASHGCDDAQGLSYCIDMTALMHNTQTPNDFITHYIQAFQRDVTARVARVNGNEREESSK